MCLKLLTFYSNEQDFSKKFEKIQKIFEKSIDKYAKLAYNIDIPNGEQPQKKRRYKTMKIRYNNNEIEFTEQYRPEEITVNGVRASMNAYAEKHDGKNWQATASGNILYYLDENGKSYAIPQKRFENIFQDELRDLIQKTGMTMRAVAESIDVPYRTMQHWRSGESVPNKFTQEVVKSEISKLVK